MIFWIGKGLFKKKQVKINLTFYPVFKDVRKILKELHLLLTPDQAHKRVFSEAPIVGFKNAKSLKDHLVRAVLPHVRGQIVFVNYTTQLKILQNFQKQSQKKLLTFLKTFWIVSQTMWYIFLNARNVILSSLM